MGFSLVLKERVGIADLQTFTDFPVQQKKYGRYYIWVVVFLNGCLHAVFFRFPLTSQFSRTFLGPDQTRPDQTRPDQTRPDQTRSLFQDFLRTFSGLYEDFLGTFSRLSHDFPKTFSGVSQDFLRIF